VSKFDISASTFGTIFDVRALTRSFPLAAPQHTNATNDRIQHLARRFHSTGEHAREYNPRGIYSR